MEIETQRTIKRTHYAILIISLVAVSMGLLGMIGITTKAYADADENTQNLLFHLAWIAAATLAITLVVLWWITVRWIRFRIQPVGKAPKTQYINAWSEAGQRLPVPEMDDVIEDPDEFAEEDLPGDVDDEEDEDNQSW